MTDVDWLMIGCLALGWIQGLYVGWYIWRKSRMTYNGVEE